MLGFSQAEIDALVSCPKTITDPPKMEMRLERGQSRNEMRLRSEAGDQEFVLFIRVNERFPENFSVGIDYLSEESGKTVPLLRCNGPHGDYNRRRTDGPHFHHHIHRTEPDALEDGQDPLSHASATSDYITVQGAILHLCRLAHVAGFQTYFHEELQLPLWEDPHPER